MAERFRALDLARLVVDEIHALMDTARVPFLNAHQLRESATSIVANVGEAYGRRPGAERNQFLRYANGSVNETNERLRTNWAARRLVTKRYWSLRNRLDVIRKMLNGLMSGGALVSEPDSRRSGRAAR